MGSVAFFRPLDARPISQHDEGDAKDCLGASTGEERVRYRRRRERDPMHCLTPVVLLERRLTARARARRLFAVPDPDTAEEGVDSMLMRGLLRARMFDGEAPLVRLGRFVVEHRLGAGAMGVVYAAHDPELDRRVAIKLLSGIGPGDELAARLRREAQAMARLAHPNVVAVFEVGTHDGAAFVAMELVDGSTLTQWLVAPDRTRAQVLAAFAAAGAGLAAAHEAGLVHRDFKPDNVLVGRDGRPRVGDFGLVRGLGGVQQTRDDLADSLSVEDTRSSEVAGTPAYMAPELFDGANASEMSDQYAFCVALYEALYRVRLHGTGSFAALVAARRRGDVSFPRTPRLSRALRRLLGRGLHRDPRARFPSMRALLVALERARRPSRALWFVGSGIAVAGLAVAALRGATETDCDRGAEAIMTGWTDDHRARVHAVIVDDGLQAGYSAAVAERVTGRLDEWMQNWQRAHAQACAAAEDGSATRELAARQMLCLDRRRLERDALVGALESSTKAVTGRAIQATAALPSPALCSEQQTMLDDVAPPSDELAVRVAEVRSQLALAKSTLDVGADPDAAVTLAQEAVRQAAEIGYSPLDAEAGLRLGVSTLATGDLPGALVLLERAYFDSIAAGHETLALQTAASLLHTIGVRAARPADAVVWWNHGDALLRKRGPSPRESHQLRNAYAAVLTEQGKYAEALSFARQSVADADAGYGADHPNAMSARQNLAGAHLGLGEYAEALAVYEAVVVGLERIYGEDHPAVATAMANTAIALGDLDRHAEALVQHERALAIFERTIGGATMEAGYTLANIGNIHRRMGNLEAALASAQRAQDALSRGLGPDHPRTVMVGGNIGHIQLDLGHLDEARAALQATIDGLTRSDPRSAELPNNYDRLGLVEMAAGDCERALSHHRKAFDLATALGLPAFTLAFQQLNMGVALECMGRDAEAIVELEQARAAWIADDPKTRESQIDSAEAALAGAMLDAGRPSESLALANAVLHRCEQNACQESKRADALALVAEAQLALGNTGLARRFAEQALEVRVRIGGSAWARGDVRWIAAQARHADGVRGTELDTLLVEARAALLDAGARGESTIAAWPAWARTRR